MTANSFSLPASPLLNVGCGTRYHKDWVNIDLKSSSPDVIEHNVLKGLPFAANCFDVVYHAHILEHVTPAQGAKLLGECFRVLKPGGIIRVVVPDLAYSCRLYLECLDKVTMDGASPTDVEHYEWAVVYLLDQMVRTQPGGEMAKFARRAEFHDFPFIVSSGGGAEMQHLHARSQSPKKKRTMSIGKMLSPRKVAPVLKRIILERMPDGVKEARFRRLGEVHKWMYDRYSLKVALEKVGFHDVQIESASTSRIADWGKYALDVDEHGNAFRPGSVYAEAIK